MRNPTNSNGYRFRSVLLSILWMSVLLLTPGVGSLSAESLQAPPPFDAEGLVEAWVGLWNSYDLSLVDKLFLTDERVTYFSSEKEGIIQGIEAVREHHRGFGFVEGGKTPERELWVEDMVANVYGTTAVVTGTWFFGDRSQDRERIQHGPLTFVYVLKGNEYRLAHLHFANY